MIDRLAPMAAVFAAMLAITPAVAQGQQQPPAATLPSDAELDALLAARNWNAIRVAIVPANSGEALSRSTHWLQTRLLSGGGSLLGFLYATRLWAIGSAMNIEDPNQDSRVTAGVIVLYTYELIVIDGAKCADPTAPSHRLDQLLMNYRPVVAYLKTKPDALKAKAVDLAIKLEKATSPRRTDDDLLCRDGMDQMRAGLAAGLTHEVPSDKNSPGKTVAVEAPPGYTPRFLPPDTYKPVQERARSEMPARLTKLLQ